LTSKAVLLVGSPKGERSTSSSLGAYLMARLEGKGWGCARHYIGSTVQSISDFEEVFADVEAAQLVVLATPLYVDSLPAPVIQFMELYGVRGSIRNADGPRLCIIVNCGFPEDQNMLAVEIAEHFARGNGMQWCGSLSMGQGGIIWGKGLEETGSRTRRVRSALDRSADALAEGKCIPEGVSRSFSKGMVPAFLYRYIANKGWESAGKRNRARNLKARPFLRAPPPKK
jgi:multimeric flavodoxin WrbA